MRVEGSGVEIFWVLYNSGLVELFANWKTAWGSLLLAWVWFWLNGWEIQQKKRLQLRIIGIETLKDLLFFFPVFIWRVPTFTCAVSRNPCSAWRTSHAPLSHRHTCLGALFWNQLVTGKMWPSKASSERVDTVLQIPLNAVFLKIHKCCSRFCSSTIRN